MFNLNLIIYFSNTYIHNEQLSTHIRRESSSKVTYPINDATNNVQIKSSFFLNKNHP